MGYDFSRNTWNLFLKEIEDQELYLFGASSKCRKFLNAYGNRLQGRVTAICDNDQNKQGTRFEGIPVVSIEVLRTAPENKVVLITSSYMELIAKQLESLGITNYFLSDMLNEAFRMWLGRVPEDAYCEIDRLREILEDHKSKILLDAIIRKRNDRIKVWYDLNDHSGYFDTGICSIQGGCFVDGGAYTGDTVEEALEKYGVQKVWAFEPDQRNYTRLYDKYKGNEKVLCQCAGLWSSKQTLSFCGTGTEGAKIAENGTCQIETVALDETISGKVDFIKMDIEGAEMEALTGAKKIIQRDKPNLAICVYHKQDDLWKIPLFIKSMVPEYHIYLRHQSDYFTDTVMYAHI